jgi:Na+/H+-dicarboxylate symporter
VDRILDMSRTTVNVISDMTATAWVAKSEAGWSSADVPAVAGLAAPVAAVEETAVA